MHARATALAAMTFAAALAGCLSSDDSAAADANRAAGAPDFDPHWSLNALVFGDDHDHTDPAQHEGMTTPNFDVLGFAPWSSNHYGGASAGGYLCGDAQATRDGRRIAAIESRSDVGFAIADVTDPAAPHIIGEFVMEHTYLYDVTVVQDGRHVVLVSAGTDNIPPQPTTGAATAVAPAGAGAHDAGRLTWRTPCSDQPVVLAAADDPLPYPMNIILVDISDPVAPRIVDNQPIVGYGHSALPFTYEGDRDVLLVTTATGAAEAVSGYFFYEVVAGTGTGTGAGEARLQLLSAYKPPGEGLLAPVNGPRGHDGWIAPHPVTGQTLAYLAGADRLVILDVSDPAAPVEVGTWFEPVADSFLHGAIPLNTTWHGRHYTVVGPEYCSHPADTPTGIAWVLDTTDPAAPRVVAGWTLPHDVEWDGGGCYTWSNHYFAVVGQTAFMSLYHGGIWAVDLSPLAHPDALADFVNLDSIGAFVPANADLPGAVEPVRWAPTIEEVIAMPDGSLVTFDGNYGLYALAFDAGHPAPAPEPWPIEAP